MKFIEQDKEESTGFSALSTLMVAVSGLLDSISHQFFLLGQFFRKLFSRVKTGLRRFVSFSARYGKQAVKTLTVFYNRIRLLGVNDITDETLKSRLGLINQINILHFLSNLIFPIVVFASNDSISVTSFVLSLAPSLVSVLVLVLNAWKKFDYALLAYFILYPFFTCLIYLGGMNLGMELYFIMYGILAIFFLHDIGQIVFSVSFSMVSYFMLTVVLKNYSFQLQAVNPAFYFFNQSVAIIFIFYGLFLIKKENTDYQARILDQNREIGDKARLLEQQTAQLSSLNSVKTRLFSIISHDLRSPMYALRELFRNLEEKRLSLEEFSELVPEVVADMDKTTGLMESVLQWAKNQFKAESLDKRNLDMLDLIHEVADPLLLQMETKKIRLRILLDKPVVAYADRDTVSVIVRNLLSNAIKFTPTGGSIIIEGKVLNNQAEISVHDTGMGMSRENIDKLKKGEHYSTNGTNNEKGTGLGLMLCQDFIIKNGGQLHVNSEKGKGSTFAFTLPLAIHATPVYN